MTPPLTHVEIPPTRPGRSGQGGEPDGAGQLVEIKNREDLGRWLENRPREDAVAIAARAALRVLPLLVTALDKDAEKHRTAIVLPIFRAAAAPWVAAVGPTKGAEVRGAAAAAAAAARGARGAVAYAAGADTAYSTATNAAAAAAENADAAIKNAAAAACAAAARAARAATYAYLAVDARDAAYTAAWSAVSADATALEQGQSLERLAARRLWPEGPSRWAADAWARLKGHLREADEDWEVWTAWYEERLYGRLFNKALEEARVLIPGEIWEQGPKVVNAEIARLIEEHTVEDSADLSGSATLSADAEVITLAEKLDAALTSVELRTALTDFNHDPSSNRVELVPYAEDLPELPTGALRADHANKLAALGAGCSSLAVDLREDAPNVPKALARDLRRYAKQAGSGPELANPRLLRMYGAALTRAHGDSETMLGLGTYLGGKLGDIVDAHARLQADYPAAVEDRMEAAADIPLAPEATPDAIAETLDLIATDLPEAEWGDLPVPSRDLPDLLQEQAEALRAFERQIDRTEDAKDRAVLERMRQQTAVSALSTVARFTVFTASVAVAAAAIAAAPFPAIGMAAAGGTIVRFVDWIFPEMLRPHLRRVINWLFLREPDGL